MVIRAPMDKRVWMDIKVCQNNRFYLTYTFIKFYKFNGIGEYGDKGDHGLHGDKGILKLF